MTRLLIIALIAASLSPGGTLQAAGCGGDSPLRRSPAPVSSAEGGATAGARDPAGAVTGMQAVLLTGNPSVDFFGGGTIAAIGAGGTGAYAIPGPGVVMMQDETSVEGEKSPWIAAGLSLLIPGAGETYAESYLKAAIFFAIDVGLWTGAYMYDQDGDEMTTEYQAYANAHWSAVRYTDWTAAHIGSLNPDVPMSGDDYLNLIYVDDPTECPPPFSCIEWEELHRMERDIMAGGGNGYTHTLPYYGEQQYYELIGKYEQFSRGWDDAGSIHPELENAVPIRNTSQRFEDYSQMRAATNDKYTTASTFVSLALVNRVLSAVDAYWSVTKYNSALRAEVRMRMMKGYAGNPVAVPTARVTWTF